MSDPDSIELVYDDECPVCRYYSRRMGVAPAEGELCRINAREQSDVMNDITEAGLDIDQGMVLKVGDDLYFGGEAIHQLALRSSRQGVVNKLAYGIFRNRRVALALYPLLVACRNLLLKILGRSRINNLKIADNDRF